MAETQPLAAKTTENGVEMKLSTTEAVNTPQRMLSPRETRRKFFYNMLILQYD